MDPKSHVINKQIKHRKSFSLMNKRYLREMIRKNAREGVLKPVLVTPTITHTDNNQHLPTAVDSVLNVNQTSGCETAIAFNTSQTINCSIINAPVPAPVVFPNLVLENTSLVNDLTNWAITGHISHENFNKLLAVLKKGYPSPSFLELPADCRTLLKTEKPKPILVGAAGNYYHFGIKEGILTTLNINNIDLSGSEDYVLEIDINVDGLPLTKSSKSQFWPILGSIVNSECNSPFVIGVFHGFGKPNTASELLDSFIEEYLEIKTSNGFLYQNKKITIRISKFICDIPAKTFILCVSGHNARSGCTKCTTEGTYLNHRMSYPNLNSKLRSDAEFRANAYEEYHTSQTPLLNLDIDLIKQFPLDYMHLVCLGVMKKLLLFWIKGNMSVRLTQADQVTLDESLKDFRKSVSYKDFSRLPRSITELERWKATEFRLFLFYAGPIVLKNRLKHSQYLHFLSLHCAIRILATPELCIQYNDFAKEQLMYFVEKFAIIYGKEYISHNVHNLYHLNEDVVQYGSLDNFSSFKYENFMGSIKKMVKTSNRPLQQFVNRVNEMRFYITKTTHFINTSECLREINIYKEPLLENKFVKSYVNVKVKYYILGLKDHCIIRDNTKIVAVKIEKIIQCTVTNKVFLMVKKYLTFKNYFNCPCDSKLFNCGVVDKLSEQDTLVPIDLVITKCIFYKNCIIPLIS